MSVFTSRVTKTIEIPHDAGQSVTIRKLAPKHLDKAAKASQLESIDQLKAIGGPAFLKELQALKIDDKTIEEARVKDPLMAFDRVELLVSGVTAWTYFGVQPGREAYEDLDDQTLDLIAREILRLSKPSLFQTQDESEADRKNG